MSKSLIIRIPMVTRSWYSNFREQIQQLHEMGMDYMKNSEDSRAVLVVAIVILFNAVPFITFLIFAAVCSALILGSAILALCIAIIIGTIIYLPVLLFCTVAGVVVASFFILVSCFFETRTSRHDDSFFWASEELN